MKVIAKILFMTLMILIAGSVWADTFHNPRWPASMYINGMPVNASGDTINPPYCWHYSYYAIKDSLGPGVYLSSGMTFDYKIHVDCTSAHAVLQWPDDRISVPLAWRSLPMVFANQIMSLYCTPTGKEYVYPGTGIDYGEIYKCELADSYKGGQGNVY